MRFLLNLPWTVVGLVGALVSVPRGISAHHAPFAFVVEVRSFWRDTWLPLGKGARAMALGNVVLLGPALEDKDLEHELVHVEQFEREPFIRMFLMWIDKTKHGNRYSKYEDEAYRRAGNVWKGKEEKRREDF